MKKKLNQCNVIENLKVTFDNGSGISGNVVCRCGCNKFNIYHTGKQTRGILAPYIVSNKHQLSIKAVCTQCKKKIVLVNNDDAREYELLELKDIKDFDIVCKLNYWPENIRKKDGTYTNNYEDLMLYVLIKGKEKAIFEYL